MTETLLDGLTFPEAPRWHDSRLWFSDFFNYRVMAVGMDGAAEAIATVPECPSGLGWMPDRTLLVVSMEDRQLLRQQAGRLVVHADLSSTAGGPCNDMVVDAAGRAYVGNYGHDFFNGEAARPAKLVRVDPDGTLAVVADDLLFPNGTVITPDGKCLIVAETMANRLTAFDIAADGGLTSRRVFATVAGLHPDGICLDEAGMIWAADPGGNRAVRMLGGDDRRTLFICTATGMGPDRAGKTDGKIEFVRVAVPGTGLP